MSQEINLYQPIKQKREFRFGGTHMLAGVVITLLGHFIYGAILLNNHYSLKSELEKLEDESATLLLSRNDISAQLAKYADTDVNEEIRKIEHLLANRQQIYEKLQADIFDTGSGYSGYFVAFARQHISGLWLTDINLASAGRNLALKGQTIAAHLVPKYLEKLSAEALLTGTNLSDFQLERPIEDEERNTRADHIDFMISTDAPDEDVL